MVTAFIFNHEPYYKMLKKENVLWRENYCWVPLDTVKDKKQGERVIHLKRWSSSRRWNCESLQVEKYIRSLNDLAN